MKKLNKFLMVCFMLLVLVLLVANNIGFNFLEWGQGLTAESQKDHKKNDHNSKDDGLSEKYIAITIKEHIIFVDQEEVALDTFEATMSSYDPDLFVIKLSSAEAKRTTYQEVVNVLKDLQFSVLE